MHNDPHTPATLTRGFEPSVVQTVGCITKLDGIPSLSILEAREANLATFLETAKEVGEGAMQTFERGIDHHGRQIKVCLFAIPFVLLVQIQILACLLVINYQQTGKY